MAGAKTRQSRCVYCGRYYRADKRVGERQKSCKRKECQGKRKRESQKRWAEANPGYFRGRYANTKQWRQQNPGYQRQWRQRAREIQDEIPPAEPVKTLVLVVPEEMLKNEIQDEIRLVKQCGCGFYVAGGKKRP